MLPFEIYALSPSMEGKSGWGYEKISQNVEEMDWKMSKRETNLLSKGVIEPKFFILSFEKNPVSLKQLNNILQQLKGISVEAIHPYRSSSSSSLQQNSDMIFQENKDTSLHKFHVLIQVFGKLVIPSNGLQSVFQRDQDWVLSSPPQVQGSTASHVEKREQSEEMTPSQQYFLLSKL